MKINHQSLLIPTLLATCISLATTEAFAGGAKGKHIRTNCPACQQIASDYNRASDQLATDEQTLDEIRKSIQVDNQFIKTDQDKIASIESMPPSPKKDEALRTANKVLSNDEADLKAHQKEEENVLKEVMKLIDKKRDLQDDLTDCEEEHCGQPTRESWAPYFNPDYYQFYNYYIIYSQLVQIQLGLMVGNMPGYRTALIRDFDDAFSTSNTANSADAGVQAKFLLGAPDHVRPTLTINADKRLSSTNTIWRRMESDVKFNNDWIVRGLVGAESPIFFNQFSAGAGVGISVFDQSVKSTIGAFNIGNNTNSIGPTAALNLTYYACSNCLFGNTFSVSLQVAADRYPDVKASNEFVSSRVNQRWQFSENLVFSTDIAPRH